MLLSPKGSQSLQCLTLFNGTYIQVNVFRIADCKYQFEIITSPHSSKGKAGEAADFAAIALKVPEKKVGLARGRSKQREGKESKLNSLCIQSFFAWKSLLLVVASAEKHPQQAVHCP